MAKFKVGDLIRGTTNNQYGITNADMTKGRVTRIFEDYPYDSGTIEVEVLEHRTEPEYKHHYFAVQAQYFELVPPPPDHHLGVWEREGW